MTGSGTLLDPYVIYDVNDLQAIENDLTAYYELANNIDASATVGWNGGLGFAPMSWFSGNFDGKGHIISGLVVNRPLEGYVGLFGATVGSVRNVKLTSVTITGKDYVGGLAGYVGGIIANCETSGTVDGENYVGGLLGLTGTLALVSCNSSCTVVATGSRGGGLIGGTAVNGYGTISDASATGSVTVTGDQAGGFVGELSRLGTTSRCFATGNVSGDSEVGGFVGENISSDIDNCYARGNVTEVNAVGVAGGFCGWNTDWAPNNAGEIKNCYSTGLLAGPGTLGGFIGDNNQVDGGLITDCFWDTQTSGTAVSDGGTGKTTAEMKTESTFTGTGWDFTTIWTICSGVNSDYPCLLGVTPSCVLAPVIVTPTVTTDPATDVIQTFATPNGTLGDDGGEACQVRFQYGLTDAYGTDTAWQPGKVTGNTFEQTISGLEPNTTYHFRAQAKNSAGTASGADRTFTTQEAVIVNRAFALAREEL